MNILSTDFLLKKKKREREGEKSWHRHFMTICDTVIYVFQIEII